MAISRFSTSRVGAGLPKYQKFWDGSTVYTPPSFYSIQTATVDSGGAADITFSSIPQTYTHLQLRALYRTTRAGYSFEQLVMQVNGDSTSSYRSHAIQGNGSSASAFDNGQSTVMTFYGGSASAALANTYSGYLIDILDYTNTNKYKTIRSLSAVDLNGDGRIYLSSGFYFGNTNAISSIKVYAPNSNLAQYTQFALYGVK